jgi:hypothetical protein
MSRRRPVAAARSRQTAAQSKRLPDRRSAGDTGIQLAKSTSSKDRFFTNCGKADKPKTSATRAKQKLRRVPFTVSRLMEFCTRRELINQTGHDVIEWALVMLKEPVVRNANNQDRNEPKFT